MKIVIAQPCFFPWVGTFEKIRLCDRYVHLDHVQYSKGSFTNRARIRVATGSKWITVPLHQLRFGQAIHHVRIDESQDWRQQHLGFLKQQYKHAPFKSDMLQIVSEIYKMDWSHIADLSIWTIQLVCDYFDITPKAGYIRSSDLRVSGKKSELVKNIVRRLGGSTYICGSGNRPVNRHYLDHEAFEEACVRIEYMQYENRLYRQQYEPFTPQLSVLDLIANEGRAGRQAICSLSAYWRDLPSAKS